jgi:predicted component of viral defense system (DUF524 family)
MEINLNHIQSNLVLQIKGEQNTLSEITDEDVLQFGEAKYQLIEGYSYEYQFNNKNVQFKTGSVNNSIVTQSKFDNSRGIIRPNIFVGTHFLEIEGTDIAVPIEVRSIKSEYRTEYRYMLESITNKCSDLIMQIDSPINQHFETDFNITTENLYQQFSFVKSIIDSLEFEEAILKIISSPSTKWEELQEETDTRKVRRYNQKIIKQLLVRNNRIPIPNNSCLTTYGIQSIPRRIDRIRKYESFNTYENQFIKNVLKEFLLFCEKCEYRFEENTKSKRESRALIKKISTFLNHSIFKNISNPKSLSVNSPVLQRKNGYREILISWLKFHLGAKLTWQGGYDVYYAGKKNIATLYEYWVFFTLLDLLKEIFHINPNGISKLISYGVNNLVLNLKQGNHIALEGKYTSNMRKINIQFSYNRPFGGGKEYPNMGSYTTTLRPDYTLSFWPDDIDDANEAEKQEMITHIHFDAKYKVNNFYDLISKSEDVELNDEENEELINEEKEELQKGTVKNHDLLKMHAYKDAIRRTAGAYVLYPGEGRDEPFRSFHEIIPGLGAFVIKPNNDDKDKQHLKSFIKQVVDNYIDRTSQREYVSVKIYDIHKEIKSNDGAIKLQIPEYWNLSSYQRLVPNETIILVCEIENNNQSRHDSTNCLYSLNRKCNSKPISIGISVTNAKYLIQLCDDKKQLFRIKEKGIEMSSVDTFSISVESDNWEGFDNIDFDKSKLDEFNLLDGNSNLDINYAVTLTDLMRSAKI